MIDRMAIFIFICDGGEVKTTCKVTVAGKRRFIWDVFQPKAFPGEIKSYRVEMSDGTVLHKDDEGVSLSWV